MNPTELDFEINNLSNIYEKVKDNLHALTVVPRELKEQSEALIGLRTIRDIAASHIKTNNTLLHQLRTVWVPVNEIPPTQKMGQLIGFSKDWIHPDFNIDGAREFFVNGDGGYTSSKWVDNQDTYVNDNESKPTHYTVYPSTEKLKNL